MTQRATPESNQIFCDLCGVHRAGGLRPFRWLGSHHARVDLGLTHLVPDAVIAVSGSHGDIWLYCLERDRGTMSADALADKFARYRLMHERARAHAGDPVWDVRADSWLMLACDDEPRAVRAAGIAVEAGLDRVWAGLASDCAASLAGGLDTADALAPVHAEALDVRLPGLVGGVSSPTEHERAIAPAGDAS